MSAGRRETLARLVSLPCSQGAAWRGAYTMAKSQSQKKGDWADCKDYSNTVQYWQANLSLAMPGRVGRANARARVVSKKKTSAKTRGAAGCIPLLGCTHARAPWHSLMGGGGGGTLSTRRHGDTLAAQESGHRV